MGWSKQERIETHDRLLAMLDGVRKEIMSKYPDVIDVDIALKNKGEQLLEQMCFRIHVKEKKPLSQLKSNEILPKEIRGIPTDVKKHTILYPEEDASKYRPVWGGIQIAAESAGIGTLGCLVTLDSDNSIQMLSNHHVLVGSNGGVGKYVGNPETPSSCCCCGCKDIGQVSAEANNAAVDCAIAKLNRGIFNSVDYAFKIIQIGPTFGSAAAVIGDKIRKRGRTTEFTEGTVSSLTRGGTVRGIARTNQIEVSPKPPLSRFSRPGDSGSAYVNNYNQVVGLHFAGDGFAGAGNKIADVISALGITIPSAGTAGAIPISGAAISQPASLSDREALLVALRDQLQASNNGQRLLQTIRDNSSEVIDLINDNREVKVAWNRYQGPSFVGHLVKNIREPQHSLPDQINGYRLQNLMIKMSEVLERHGSRKLAEAVEDYALTAFNFAEEYQGPASLETLLNKYEFCKNCGNLKNTVPYA